MKQTAKKILFSSIITLLVSAGLTTAAEALSQHVDAAPSATVLDEVNFSNPMPCQGGTGPR